MQCELHQSDYNVEDDEEGEVEDEGGDDDRKRILMSKGI